MADTTINTAATLGAAAATGGSSLITQLAASLLSGINTDNFLGIFGGTPSTWRQRYEQLHGYSMDQIASFYISNFSNSPNDLNQFIELFSWKAPTQGNGYSDRSKEMSYDIAQAWNACVIAAGHSELQIPLSSVKQSTYQSVIGNVGSTITDLLDNAASGNTGNGAAGNTSILKNPLIWIVAVVVAFFLFKKKK